MSVPLREVSSRLISGLRVLADDYGAAGVLDVAKQLWPDLAHADAAELEVRRARVGQINAMEAELRVLRDHLDDARDRAVLVIVNASNKIDAVLEAMNPIDEPAAHDPDRDADVVWPDIKQLPREEHR